MNQVKEILAGYSVKIIPLKQEDGGGYKAFYQELGPNMKGFGESPAEAAAELAEVLLDVLTEKDVADFPAATLHTDWADYSGRVTLRLPKVLHAQLDRLAEDQGTSLNQLMCLVLQSAATALNAGHAFGCAPAEAKTVTRFVVNDLEDERPTSAPHRKLDSSHLTIVKGYQSA
jgi:hypothetical protein